MEEPIKPYRNEHFIYQSSYVPGEFTADGSGIISYYPLSTVCLLIPIKAGDFDILISYLIYYEIEYITLKGLIFIDKSDLLTHKFALTREAQEAQERGGK